MNREIYVGLMSGTSMDAVDAVAVDFAPRPMALLGSHSLAMPEVVRRALMDLAAERSRHPLQCFGQLALPPSGYGRGRPGRTAGPGLPYSDVSE